MSCGYSSVVRWLPGHVLLRFQLTLVATRSQHSTCSPPQKKNQKKTEILEKVIQQMFKVMQMVAEFSCNYVTGSRQSCSRFGKY